MKLTKVSVVRYRLPFREPHVTAAGTAAHREGFIVEIETDDGLHGLGEASLLLHVMVGIDELEASLVSLATRAAGADVAEFGGSVSVKRERGWPAFSIAITDVIAKARGVPVSALFSSAPGRIVRVNALIGGLPADGVRAAAQRAREDGYGTVKLKVGVTRNVDEERRRVVAAREGLGPDGRLRLDANGAWAESQAVETLRAVAQYGIEYCEQPIAPGDLEAMRRVREALSKHVCHVPIAADEDVVDCGTALRILEQGSADVVVLKPLMLAGSGELRRLLELCGPGRAVVTTSIDSGVGTGFALQLASATATERAHGLATLPLLEDDLILNPGLPVEKGYMRLPDGPGLGVELDEAALARYSVAEWEFRA